MKTKVKFEVVSQQKLMDEVADVMSRCDLGICGIEAPITEIFSWDTTTEVDKKYLAKMRKVIKQGMDKNERRVISIRKIK